MKYAIVIPDGAADNPIEELGGKTPLAAAVTPNMDWIASNGRCGSARTIPSGMPCGSDVAIMSVLGYNPKQWYTGRGPLEAAAQGLNVGPDEWIFRCNLVTIIDGVMKDYSAGHIRSEEAWSLLDELQRQIGGETVHFHHGVSYRHLMTIKREMNVKTVPPHDIMDKKIDSFLPTGYGADSLRTLILRSQAVLSEHEINMVRRDLGENPATSIWLWGQGKMPQLPSFAQRFGRRGAAITAVDLVRGLSRLIGWDIIEVPGATGYIDTNYAGKGAAAAEAIDKYDLVLVHIEAPDEAGHSADFQAKVKAIHQIDEFVVGPVLDKLRSFGEDWRILVMPDHPTPCGVRTHTPDPVPFALAGKQIGGGVVQAPFTEQTAAASDLYIPHGYEIMEYFLTIR